jgi:hypothetical protein
MNTTPAGSRAARRSEMTFGETGVMFCAQNNDRRVRCVLPARNGLLLLNNPQEMWQQGITGR